MKVPACTFIISLQCAVQYVFDRSLESKVKSKRQIGIHDTLGYITINDLTGHKWMYLEYYVPENLFDCAF